MRQGSWPGEGGPDIGTLPRDLHPAAWWTWALGLAAAASRTTNPWLLVLLVLVVCVTVLARRTDAPWAMSFRLYLVLGLVVIVLRVVFRVIFGGGYGTNVLVDLPEVSGPKSVMPAAQSGNGTSGRSTSTWVP